MSVDVETPWKRVYLLVATACVNSGHFLTLLQYVIAFGSIHKRDISMPSYVPNWNGRRSSSQQFTFRDPLKPPQDYDISSKAPNSIYGIGIMHSIVRDVSIPGFQSEHLKDLIISSTNDHGKTIVDMATLFLFCRESVKDKEIDAPHHLLA